MDLVVQTIVTGISLGASYALVAVGLTIVFGIGKLVNFAHGEFLMLGAFLAVSFSSLGLPYLLVVPIAIAGTALIGWLVEWLVLSRGLYNAPEGSSIIVTFGLSLVFINGIQILYGSSARSLNSPLNSVRIGVEAISLDAQRVFTTVTALLVMIGLGLWLKHSRLGSQFRAVSQNPRGALYTGINVVHIRRIAFVVGVTLAAIAGVLIAPSQSVYPTMGQNAVVTAFTVVIMGGLGSVLGAAVGGLAIGLVYSFVATYASAELTAVVGWILVIIVLLFRPQGILGSKPVRA